MTEKTIVFDLDGTLVDTAPDLVESLNHLLQRHGLASIDLQNIRNNVGQGARKIIETGFAIHEELPTPEQLDSLTEEFVQYYSQNIAIKSQPFPGVVDQLETLKKEGAILAVCTNKRKDLANILLAELSLDNYFSAILGGDSLPVRKPHPDHVIGTITQAGGLLERSIMVGDTAADINAAKAARVPVIAVTFGYANPDFDGAAPDVTIDHYNALPDAIARLLT